MRALVTFIVDGTRYELAHGDFIGRLPNAALRIDHPAISEAHALVSLRADRLCLLTLRGRLVLDGVRVNDVRLEVGQSIELSRDVRLTVAEVVMPERVLAIEGTGIGCTALGSVNSLIIGEHGGVELATQFSSRAEAWLWSHVDTWLFRQRDEATPTLVTAGQQLIVGGREFNLVTLSLHSTSASVTADSSTVGERLVIETRYNTVHIHRRNRRTVVVAGHGAVIISELAAMEVPVPWSVIAGELWSEEDPVTLRRRWDVCLWRLRTKLREAGLRDTLVRADHTGNVELLLFEGDTVDVQS